MKIPFIKQLTPEEKNAWQLRRMDKWEQKFDAASASRFQGRGNVIIITIVVILAAMPIIVWVTTGISRKAAEATHNTLQYKIADLERENTALKSELDKNFYSPQFVENYAKDNLGFVHYSDREIVSIIREEKLVEVHDRKITFKEKVMRFFGME